MPKNVSQETVPLPDKWEAGIGERSDQHYTKWFYHTERKWEIHVYWDEPRMSGDDKHTVQIFELRKQGEDYVTKNIAEETSRCDSEDEAEKEAIRMMKKAKNGEYKHR